MKNEYLEELLLETGNENTTISKELIQDTKNKIRNKNFLGLVLTFVALRFLILISLGINIYLKFGLKGIVILYIMYVITLNLSIVIILVFLNTYKLKYKFSNW